MELSLKSKRTTLKTAQKYCATDITLDVTVQDKSVTPGSAPQTVTADTGYAALGTVTVAAVSTESGAATPSAAAQTVTPSEGKYFDTFTVAATPLDPASEATAGTSDVEVTPTAGKIGLTSVTVHPTPTETKTATANGTVTPDSGKLLSSVTVNVPPYAQDVATTAQMNANLVAANVGHIYRFTGTTDDTYTHGDIYIVEG